MPHTATSRRPALPLDPRNLDVDDAYDDEATQRGVQLPEAQAIQAFRSALDARGAGPLELFLVEHPHPLFCHPCFHDAVTRLDYRLERVAPQADEEGVLERFALLSWRFDRQAADPEDEVEPDGEAVFYADRHLGLCRLAPTAGGRPTLWVWTFLDGAGRRRACLAAPEREDLRPFLTELHRLDVAHDRRFAGLILLGSACEGRTRRAAVSWDDVVLPPGMRQDLERTVNEFFTSGDLYRRHGLPHRRGILLAGPPGNGKTSVLKAIGTMCDVPVVVASLDDPRRGYNARNAFQRAARLAPAIVCFEDLDALIDDGPGLSQFLNQLDGLEPLEGVLVLATTNRPDRIDPAIAKRPSRFDRVFLIPEPEEAVRAEYLRRQLGGDAPEGAVERLARETPGYSLAFLKELVLQARLAAVRGGREALTSADLDEALETTQEHIRLAARGLEHRGAVGF